MKVKNSRSHKEKHKTFISSQLQGQLFVALAGPAISFMEQQFPSDFSKSGATIWFVMEHHLNRRQMFLCAVAPRATDISILLSLSVTTLTRFRTTACPKLLHVQDCRNSCAAYSTGKMKGKQGNSLPFQVFLHFQELRPLKPIGICSRSFFSSLSCTAQMGKETLRNFANLTATQLFDSGSLHADLKTRSTTLRLFLPFGETSILLLYSWDKRKLCWTVH